jgi:phage-related protein
MVEEWIIFYYLTSNGSNPVHDFITSQSENAQGKIGRTLDLLSKYNIQVREPHVKKIGGTPLWELRILGGDSLRIFYVVVLSKSFLLLHGFLKKTNKTPANEIKIAINRLTDWRRRNK